MGEGALEGGDQVCDVEAPQEGAEAAAFSESFEDVEVGCGGIVPVQDADADGVVQGAKVLPDVVGDPIGVEAEEELLAKDRREGKGDVAEKDVGGLAEVFVAVLDVGEEGVHSVEGLAAAQAGALGRCEQVVLGDVARQGIE